VCVCVCHIIFVYREIEEIPNYHLNCARLRYPDSLYNPNNYTIDKHSFSSISFVIVLQQRIHTVQLKYDDRTTRKLLILIYLWYLHLRRLLLPSPRPRCYFVTSQRHCNLWNFDDLPVFYSRANHHSPIPPFINQQQIIFIHIIIILVYYNWYYFFFFVFFFFFFLITYYFFVSINFCNLSV
jgi:hypothetical protein